MRRFIIFDDEGELVAETDRKGFAMEIADLFHGYVRDTKTLGRVYDTAVSVD